MKHWKLALTAYLGMAVFTFGHCAEQTYSGEKAEYQACQKQQQFCFDSSTELGALGGFMAAILWPLYWSWELQS